MAELQQPDIVGNYLSRYNEAQQRQQAIADRQRTYQRQDRQDEMAEMQFEGQQDAQKLDMAIKRGSAMASIIGSVRDGDVQGFEAAKQRAAQELGIDPKQMAHLTINDLPRLRTESGLALKQLQEQAMRANIRQSDAAAAASRAATARAGMPAIDPNSGARVAPPGLQGRDSGELTKARASSDAAANIVSTLMSAAPALSQIKTGAGTGLARNIAGVFSATGFFPSADEFTKNYDAIEQASKTIGIDTLQKVGGSDTERELLTAIQTTVNPDVQPEENVRRFQDQIAASDILAKKAQFMTEWVNKAGSLSYSLPNGMTWPQFWSEYQKAAWADHRKAAQRPTGGAGNYRQEQRDLLNGKTTQGGPVPPPGFEIVK